jgi:hypothetical protein
VANLFKRLEPGQAVNPEREHLDPDIVRRGPQPIIPLAHHGSSPSEKLLSWLIHFWPGESITLRDVRAFGPNCARDPVDAVRLTQALTEFGWLKPAPVHRRDMRRWTIVREPSRELPKA